MPGATANLCNISICRGGAYCDFQPDPVRRVTARYPRQRGERTGRGLHVLITQNTQTIPRFPESQHFAPVVNCSYGDQYRHGGFIHIRRMLIQRHRRHRARIIGPQHPDRSVRRSKLILNFSGADCRSRRPRPPADARYRIGLFFCQKPGRCGFSVASSLLNCRR